MPTFAVGAEYTREDLLVFVGSKQQQSGIIWGHQRLDCLILTSGGRHCAEAGYEDRQYSDGSWNYFGQGQRGDQDANSYANRLLVDRKRMLLLFSTREPTNAEAVVKGTHRKTYRFEGVYQVGTWGTYMPATGQRSGDRLLLFHLIPV